jgi:hypothetical protein
MYKRQVLLVGDIVDAAKTGKWRQPPPVLKSPAARMVLITLSIMQYFGLPLLLIWVLASSSS